MRNKRVASDVSWLGRESTCYDINFNNLDNMCLELYYMEY